MVHHSLRAALITLALAAAGAPATAAQEPPAVYTAVKATQGASGTNTTTTLHVENKAQVPVRLMGCPGPTIQPGQSIDVPVVGLSRFWVVPQNANVDCHTGPFDNLYYFVADFLGDQPTASVGYMASGAAGQQQPSSAGGQQSQIAGVQLAAQGSEAGAQAQQGGAPAAASTGPNATGTAEQQGSGTAAAASTGPNATGTQSGTQQGGGAPGAAAAGGAGASTTEQQGNKTGGQQGGLVVHCRADGCDPTATVAKMPDSLRFTILSAQPPKLRAKGFLSAAPTECPPNGPGLSGCLSFQAP